jgi:hypothetical protein
MRVNTPPPQSFLFATATVHTVLPSLSLFDSDSMRRGTPPPFSLFDSNSTRRGY